MWMKVAEVPFATEVREKKSTRGRRNLPRVQYKISCRLPAWGGASELKDGLLTGQGCWRRRGSSLRARRLHPPSLLQTLPSLRLDHSDRIRIVSGHLRCSQRPTTENRSFVPYFALHQLPLCDVLVLRNGSANHSATKSRLFRTDECGDIMAPQQSLTRHKPSFGPFLILRIST